MVTSIDYMDVAINVRRCANSYNSFHDGRHDMLKSRVEECGLIFGQH